MNSSSVGFAEGKKLAEEIGIDAYISKPSKLSELKININLALGRAAPVEAKEHIEAVDTNRPLKILLVEDNSDNRNLIIAYLKKSQHGIEVAENGKIAFEKVTSGENYDLVLMDVEMPVMDGLTATRKIREWEAEQSLSRTPIVALTAHALKEHEEDSKEAGCDGHITKPIKKAVLLETLKEYSLEA